MTPAERPLSPFQLGTIYKLQLTSVLSFAHRATGLGSSVGTIFLVWWLVAAASGDAAFASAQWFFGSWLGLLLLLGWCFASSSISATASAISSGMPAMGFELTSTPRGWRWWWRAAC